MAEAEGSLEYPPNCCIGGSTKVVSFVVKAVAIGSTEAAAAINRIEKETHPMVVELGATDLEGVAFADYWEDSQAPVV